MLSTHFPFQTNVPETVEVAPVAKDPPDQIVGCRITRDARLVDMDTGFESAIRWQGGLALNAEVLMPRHPTLHKSWLQILSKVAHNQEARLFCLLTDESVSHVGILPGGQPGQLCVRLPQRRLCSSATLCSYASLIGLTPRETLVTDKITQGLTPAQVAYSLQTRESTVRTQIKSVLAKSDHHSVRELLITLACLPSVSTDDQPASRLL